ncbi:BolA-like protein [Tyrophagus putrescentiae]|nr:BolA-like protein [Tyrophagus putrescentiae]
MVITVDQLKGKLVDKLGATHVELEDVSDGCGAKFVAKIVSDRFEGLSLLEQHRLVNETLAEEMASIHSFRMKTLTPAKSLPSRLAEKRNWRQCPA